MRPENYPWQRPSRWLKSKAPGGYGTIVNGYRYVTDPKTRERKYEHRLVWEFHNGAIPPNHHVHHINGDRLDNRLENLSLVRDTDHIREHHSTYVRVGSEWMKTCTKCKRTLPLTDYHRDVRGLKVGGLCPKCKLCKAAHKRAIYKLKAGEASRHRSSTTRIKPELD